ncbi:zf-TFIIB domain-containing protein [Nocardia miyunensis]|uniref:TFIIB-type zinc ribbon-containing protein n=1 Tax=Nocardia miyunensis TaxID=282684 RepID=UPI00082EFDE8|nr:zf-TFIIB domain-containing protein [Nocardia miyunensis]
MICPKCQNPMRTVNKGGVNIDQCQGCRGIFLDPGELEQIVAAENAYYGNPPAYQPPPGYPQSPQYPPPRHYGDSPSPYGGHYGDSPRPYGAHYRDSPRPYGHGHRRKRGFLGDLFD